MHEPPPYASGMGSALSNHAGETHSDSARRAYEDLSILLTEAWRREEMQRARIEAAAPSRVQSARNLVHYLSMREHDLRPLQKRLASLGLSSLGRAEPCVEWAISAVRYAAARLAEPPMPAERARAGALPFEVGRSLLDRQTDALLGPRPRERTVRIMVTMPTDAATDTSFVRGCVERGMNVMRINTAHDGPDEWLAMIENLRDARRATGRDCRVFADLSGPKLRTTSIVKNGQRREAIRLHAGDTVLLHSSPELEVEMQDPEKRLPMPAVGCSHAEVLSGLKMGHQVWFDDGKIGAEVASLDQRGATLRVQFTKPGGQKLRLEKGLNLPDTRISLPALSNEDRAAMRVLAPHVDGLALSFVRTAKDATDLRMALAEISDRPIAHVLKIETREGFHNLPSLLFELMRTPVGGVMIARGDLAIECGFERMAEIQEEILWLCEAAHTPVIWATEVLASLARQGRPTRAEITDAAMAQRAECVMLNKGPEILSAVRTLSDILTRMEPHQRKKMSMFRPLHVATAQVEGVV